MALLLVEFRELGIGEPTYDIEAQAREDARLEAESERVKEEAARERPERRRPRRQSWQVRDGVERRVNDVEVAETASAKTFTRRLEYVPAYFIEHEYR